MTRHQRKTFIISLLRKFIHPRFRETQPLILSRLIKDWISWERFKFAHQTVRLVNWFEEGAEGEWWSCECCQHLQHQHLQHQTPCRPETCCRPPAPPPSSLACLDTSTLCHCLHSHHRRIFSFLWVSYHLFLDIFWNCTLLAFIVLWFPFFKSLKFAHFYCAVLFILCKPIHLCSSLFHSTLCNSEFKIQTSLGTVRLASLIRVWNV